MEVTSAMLAAAVRKAVELALVPRAGFIDQCDEGCRKVEAVVQAAIDAEIDRPWSPLPDAMVELRDRAIDDFRAGRTVPMEDVLEGPERAEIERLRAERDALLVACRAVLVWAKHSGAFIEPEDEEVLRQVCGAVASAQFAPAPSEDR